MMPVSIEDRYKEALAELRFASEVRLKIVAGWFAVYAALAAMFVWIRSSSMQPAEWVVPLLGIVVTLLFWLGDKRNAAAIGAAKSVGEEIEKDRASAIPEDQRYFGRLSQDKTIRHGILVNIFAISMVALLSVATFYLIYKRAW